MLPVIPTSYPKAVATRSRTFGDLLLTGQQCAERGAAGNELTAVMGRSTNVESASRTAQGSMAGIEWVTRMQRARSRDHFRTSLGCRGSCSRHDSRWPPPGQKWPARPRSLSEPRGRLFEYLLGSAEPSARRDRSKWLHGSPAESVMFNGCRVLQAGAPGGAEKGG